MKYLKVFETTSEQQSYLNGNIITPSITITRDNESTIHYVPEVIEGELSFPLYLTLPFVEDTPGYGNTKCYKLENSEIITELWDFLCQHILLDRVDNEPLGTWYVPDNFCNNYPIYVNNIKVTDIIGDFMWNDDPTKPSMLLFRGDNIYECSIDENGIYCYIRSLITFTINGTEYQANEGMTWIQWCNSTYNTDGYKIIEDELHLTNYIIVTSTSTSSMGWCVYNINNVHDYDLIKDGIIYTTKFYDVGGGSMN